MPRSRRLFRICLVALALLCALWGGWTLHVRLVAWSGSLPRTAGNSPAVRDLVPAAAPGTPFSFAAVGDLRCDETFDVLAEHLRGQPLAFLVLLGDLTRNPTEADHRYLQAKARRFWRFPFPVFFLPGNHDVAPESYPLSRFEEVYGETCFTIRRAPYRFVFLSLLPRPLENRASLAFLARELAGAAGSNDMIFVFGHVAPHVSGAIRSREFDGEKELLDLLARHRVAYYLCGDFHNYARVTVGPTTFLVAGGGGSPLKKTGAFAFHHAAVISLEANAVVERLCVTPAAWRLTERPRYLATHALTAFGWPAAVVPLVIGLGILAALGLTRRKVAPNA